ncbi:MAG: hypothetical protein EBZ48_10690 [Proteobacteria bacterium]|nr:hypothetical protein [Pseudomonadota bacterium]
MRILHILQLAMRTLALLLTILIASSAMAQTVTVRGTLKGASGYTLALVNKDGSSKTQKLTAAGNFSFAPMKLKSLAGTSLQLIDANGRFFGPVVLGKKGRKVSTTLSGKSSTPGKVLQLGRLTLRAGYAIAASTLKSAVYTTPLVNANAAGKPTGAGNLGVVRATTSNTATTQRVQISAGGASNPGDDTDRDGILNAFDADDNGNGVLDAADPAARGTDTPYVGINFDFRRTLNAWVRDGLSNAKIDAMVSGENAFSSIFF